MEKNYPIISIGRRFGAGGRAIGRELSALLGFPFYDYEVLKEAAEEFGFSREIFLRADERRPSIFRRLVTQMYGIQENFNMGTALTGENIYQAQSLVIRAIAKRGSCIIIGRTADYILRDFPGLVKIFLHAPLAFRSRKIVERGDASSMMEAIEMAKAKDRSRQEYYHYFTGREWGSASNYDLCMDSSLLSAKGCAEIIASYVKKFS